MTETPSMTSGKFVRKGFLLRDLLQALQADPPTPTTKSLRKQLAIEQNCDFTDQLVNSFAQASENSLPAYIRQYVRNNASDITELPAMERFYVNAIAETLGKSAISLQRPGAELSPDLMLSGAVTRPADFLATKNAPWKLTNGVFSFNRRASVQINYSFLAGLTVPESTPENVQWRFSDSGTNRIVTLTPTLHFEGSLTVGSTLIIPLMTAMFYPEQYSSQTRIPLEGSFTVVVGDNMSTYGRIDRMRFSLQRSTWVAQSPTGIYDRVVLPKNTNASTLDTTNYVELIEL